MESDTPNDGIDPDRLAGRGWDVTLSYTVTFRVSQIASPEKADGIKRAQEVAYPGGPTDPADYELVNSEADAKRDIWMDDPDAPKAAEWLPEPNVPSEETYWNDERHFGDDDESESTTTRDTIDGP